MRKVEGNHKYLDFESEPTVAIEMGDAHLSYPQLSSFDTTNDLDHKATYSELLEIVMNTKRMKNPSPKFYSLFKIKDKNNNSLFMENIASMYVFNMEYNLPVFPMHSLHRSQAKVTDKQTHIIRNFLYLPYLEWIKNYMGISVYPRKVNKNYRVMSVKIAGEQRYEIYDRFIEHVKIMKDFENFVVTTFIDEIQIYFISPANIKDAVIEYPYGLDGKITILANYHPFMPAPHFKDFRVLNANDTAISYPMKNIRSDDQMEDFRLHKGGKVSSWKNVVSLAVVDVREAIKDAKEGTVKFDFYKAERAPYKADLYVYEPMYRYAFALRLRSDDMKDFLKPVVESEGHISYSPLSDGVKFYYKYDDMLGSPRILQAKMNAPYYEIDAVTASHASVIYDYICGVKSKWDTDFAGAINVLDVMFGVSYKTIADSKKAMLAPFYSMFSIKYNEQYTYNSFISEHKDLIKELYESKGRTLVVAPTGAGKTKAFIETALENNYKVIYAVPYTSQVEQLANTYNIIGLKAGVEVDYKKLDRTFVTTYDQLEKVFDNVAFVEKEWILVVDEVHNLIQSIDFRPVVRYIMTYADMERIIGITATPETAVDTSLWNKFIKFEPKNNKALFNKVDVQFVDRYATTKLMQELRNNPVPKGKLDIIYVNNTTQINILEKALEKQGYRVGTVYSIIKNAAPQYKNIIKYQEVKDVDILLTTSVIADGVNILNKNIRNVYIIGEYNGITIRQFLARFRYGYDKLVMFSKLSDKYKAVLLPDFILYVKHLVAHNNKLISSYEAEKYREGYLSVFDTKEKVINTLLDDAIYSDDSRLKIDKSVIYRKAQQKFYNVLFRKEEYVKLFFEYFYGITPSFFSSEITKQDKYIVEAKDEYNMLIETFNSIMAQKSKEVAKQYLSLMKPDWNINDLEAIELPEDVSKDVKDIVNMAGKAKEASDTVYNTVSLVSDGYSWEMASKVSVKVPKIKSKLSKQLYYLAMFRVMDMLDRFDLLRNFPKENFVDYALIELRYLASMAKVLHHQTFEALTYNSTLIRERDNVPGILMEDGRRDVYFKLAEKFSARTLKQIFTYTHDYTLVRPGIKRVVPLRTDRRGRVLYDVVYDRTRHVGYTDIKRKTIQSLVDEMDLPEEERKQYEALLKAKFNLYMKTILERVLETLWKYDDIVETDGFANICGIAMNEFASTPLKVYTGIRKKMNKIKEKYDEFAIYTKNGEPTYRMKEAGNDSRKAIFEGYAIYTYKDLIKDVDYLLAQKRIVAGKRHELAEENLKYTSPARKGIWVGTNPEALQQLSLSA